MTSSNGSIFRVTGPLCGEFTGPGEFPTQRPVRRSFDAFFDLRLNKRLSKQPWGWWFKTPSCSLWRQCNVIWLFSIVGPWLWPQHFMIQCQPRWQKSLSQHMLMCTRVLRICWDVEGELNHINDKTVHMGDYFANDIVEIRCKDYIMGLIGLIHESHITPIPYSTMHQLEHKCVHFSSEWCIVGYGTGVLRDLLGWSIVCTMVSWSPRLIPFLNKLLNEESSCQWFETP